MVPGIFEAMRGPASPDDVQQLSLEEVRRELIAAKASMLSARDMSEAFGDAIQGLELVSTIDYDWCNWSAGGAPQQAIHAARAIQSFLEAIRDRGGNPDEMMADNDIPEGALDERTLNCIEMVARQ